MKKDKRIAGIAINPRDTKVKFIHFLNKEGDSIFACDISNYLYEKIIDEIIVKEGAGGYLELKGGKDHD